MQGQLPFCSLFITYHAVWSDELKDMCYMAVSRSGTEYLADKWREVTTLRPDCADQ